MVNGPGEIPNKLITPIVKPPAPPINTEPGKRTEPEADRSVQAPDRVELSPKAREVQSLVQTAQNVPEVRPETVTQVTATQSTQEDIKAQNSDIPAAKVAEKLLLEG